MVRQATTPSRVVVIISTLVVVMVLLLPSTGHADDITATVEHHVVAGDTLWTIADEATPPGEDVRTTIEAIKELNGLADSVIVPGQRLIVPADSDR